MSQSKVTVQSVSCPPFPRTRLLGIQVHENQRSKATRRCQTPNVREREVAKTMDMSASGPLNCSRIHMLHFTRSLWMKVLRLLRQIWCMLLAPTESPLRKSHFFEHNRRDLDDALKQCGCSECVLSAFPSNKIAWNSST